MTSLHRYSLPLLASVLTLNLAGCSDNIDLDPLDNAPVVESTVRPAPIYGGTLTVTSDGVAIAADPDRDALHIVDLDAGAVTHTVALAPGDRPHRVALGSAGQAHVVLRGGGGFATVDLDAGTVTARHSVCSEPRGIAFHAGQSALYVACADGLVVKLSEAGQEQQRWQLEPDLRDVVIAGGEVKISLFRAAALVGLDGSRIDIPNQGDNINHVAWRTWVTASGEIAMLHQIASTAEVPIDPAPEELPDGGSPYGGGDGPCRMGIVNTAVTRFVDGLPITTNMLFDSNLTVDAVISADGTIMAMAVPGVIRPEDRVQKVEKKGRNNVDFDFGVSFTPSAVRVDPTDTPGCGDFFGGGGGEEYDYGQVTAVAFTASDRLVVQSREPARLVVMDPFGSERVAIPLPGESRFDTGHEIFHRATDSGLSCASCHPEGTDDGHVWTFSNLGPRRTQPIDVGLRDTAPYHWDGDMADVDVLMSEVLAHRMGGKRQSTARSDSFTRWLFDQQQPAASTFADASLVASGEALFRAYDCTKCHNGEALGGQRTETIAGEAKQVPTLRRVSLHPPYMHDGRSATLEAAIQDMVETTRHTSAPDADVAAMAAYLRTL